MFAYEQCLLCLSHYPNIWLDAAAYLEEASRLLIEKGDQQSGRTFAEEAASMYERAISGVLKKNALIYFAYADFEEVCYLFKLSNLLFPNFCTRITANRIGTSMIKFIRSIRDL